MRGQRHFEDTDLHIYYAVAVGLADSFSAIQIKTPPLWRRFYLDVESEG